MTLHMEGTIVIITCYNWPRALHKVFYSISRQSILPDEVIVADDGSRPEIQKVIQYWQKRLVCRLTHVWQPDSQFRAARARNLALRKTEFDHIVMIDGDCLVPPKFVEHHQRLIADGVMVAGGRHLLSERQTEVVLRQPIEAPICFDEKKFQSLPLGSIVRDHFWNSWRDVRTCNLGVNRSDLIAIGGFDESYVGWGMEDSDLVIRLMNKGVRVRSGRLAVCVKHLHHPIVSRDNEQKNASKLAKLLARNIRG